MRMRPIVFVALLWGLFLSASLLPTAQTLATSTTLSSAVTATQAVWAVASASGFTAGNFAYADYEAVQIVSVSGTNVTVLRGQMGTVARAHASSETVITGVAQFFQQADPDFGAACTRGAGQAAYLPWINVQTGNVFVCRTGGTWNVTNVLPITFNSLQAFTG